MRRRASFILSSVGPGSGPFEVELAVVQEQCRIGRSMIRRPGKYTLYRHALVARLGTVPMVVDHVGVVVKSLERGIEIWRQAFGYQAATTPVVNSRQQVRVVFLEKPGSILIKLIEPTDPASPVFPLAARGGGLHHLCFRGPSIAGAQAAIRAAGGRTLVEPQPGEAFENELIAFSYLFGLPVEIIETEKKAGLKGGSAPR